MVCDRRQAYSQAGRRGFESLRPLRLTESLDPGCTHGCTDFLSRASNIPPRFWAIVLGVLDANLAFMLCCVRKMSRIRISPKLLRNSMSHRARPHGFGDYLPSACQTSSGTSSSTFQGKGAAPSRISRSARWTRSSALILYKLHWS